MKEICNITRRTRCAPSCVAPKGDSTTGLWALPNPKLPPRSCRDCRWAIVAALSRPDALRRVLVPYRDKGPPPSPCSRHGSVTARLTHVTARSRLGLLTARLGHGSARTRLGSITSRLGHGWAGGSAPTGGASLRPEMAALPPHPTPQPRSSSTAAASSTDCRSPAPAAA